MSAGSAPVVLSCNVRTVDDLHLGYSLSVDDASKPELPASRPLSIASIRAFVWAYGADEAVRDLHLETHLADAPALSHLTVRGGAANYMVIHAADANLIVLDWYFPTYTSPVYLVYNAVDQSITAIPSDPWSLTPVQPEMRHQTDAVMSVLIAGLPGGDGGSYALVKMAETRIYLRYGYEPVERQDVLYVWRSSSRSPRWDMIRSRFPSEFKGDNIAHSYTAVLPFTCGGHAFWADLFRGVMYCNLDALLSALNGGPELEFGFIGLPCQPPCSISCAIEMRSDMYRTIGLSGESSVKFVTIDGFVQIRDFVDCTVRVWSLSPEEDMTRWTEQSLCLGSLTEQDEFKKAGLPTDMVPMYPGLSAEEDDVVYFMLGEYTKCCSAHRGSKKRCKGTGYIPIAKNPQYHLRVDMRRGVLLASARLPNPTSPSMLIASTSVVPTTAG